MAQAAAGRGRWERAAQLFGAVEALSDKRLISGEAGGAGVPPERHVAHEPPVAATRAGLGEAAFLAAWARGRAMTPEQAANYALEEEEGETE